MTASKAKYEKLVISILNLVFSGQVPTIELVPDCAEKDFQNILEQCVDNGFIKGLEIYRTSDGRLHYDCILQPYVTFKGISFIESIYQAKAMEIANAANKNSLSARLLANKSFILSMIALLVTLLTNADKIIHNLQKILSYLNSI